MKERRTLIACNIFRDEIEWALAREERFEVEVVGLPAGLHSNLEIMEAELTRTLTAQKAPRPELRLMFGRGCLPHMEQFARQWGVPVLPVKNCLGALVGDRQTAELEKGRTLVATVGWVRRMWLRFEGGPGLTGWDEVDFRQNFGRYDRILLLDTGLAPLSEDELWAAFDLIQVPIEFEPCSLDHFAKLWADFLA